MARAVRAADISGCIHCFTACGKPCGEIGRATAVSCGVCLNGCRGACWGLGTCVAGLGRCFAVLGTVVATAFRGLVHLLVVLCTFCCTAVVSCLGWLFFVIAQIYVVLLVVGLLTIMVLLGYVYWDPIVHYFDLVRNDTVDYYNRTINDPDVIQLWNKTEQFYGEAKDKLNELVNHPDVQHVADKTVKLYDAASDHLSNKTEEYYKAAKEEITHLANHPEVVHAAVKTVELYDTAKDQVLDTYEQVRRHEAVQSAVNGTISFFNSLKNKIWG